nr:RNA-directed DNA polymerase, eukaryota, reverse transcriptase zinc-binding domain protein [Tanacetum cinerariifolium]
GGLGVSSLYALNRALMFKWVWRFTTQQSSLWARVIKAIHGDDGKWFHSQKLGNEKETVFWDEIWCDNEAFKYRYPRLYALETCKSIDVAAKFANTSIDHSFRRCPRSGVEQTQLFELRSKLAAVSLVDARDKWKWSLEGSGDFSVFSIGKLIDNKRLPDVSSKTRWIKVVPIKINIHAWKVRLDYLPTRLNISRTGMANNVGAILVIGRGLKIVSTLTHPISPPLQSPKTSPELLQHDTCMEASRSTKYGTINVIELMLQIIAPGQVVKLKVEGSGALNMKRMHEILEV